MIDRKVIWAEPVANLATQLRDEAKHQREQWGDEERATQLESMAKRVEAAIESGAERTWVSIAVAAEFTDKHPETIRARCRTSLEKQGLARKFSGVWQVHVNALAA